MKNNLKYLSTICLVLMASIFFVGCEKEQEIFDIEQQHTEVSSDNITFSIETRDHLEHYPEILKQVTRYNGQVGLQKSNSTLDQVNLDYFTVGATENYTSYTFEFKDQDPLETGTLKNLIINIYDEQYLVADVIKYSGINKDNYLELFTGKINEINDVSYTITTLVEDFTPILNTQKSRLQCEYETVFYSEGICSGNGHHTWNERNICKCGKGVNCTPPYPAGVSTGVYCNREGTSGANDATMVIDIGGAGGGGGGPRNDDTVVTPYVPTTIITTPPKPTIFAGHQFFLIDQIGDKLTKDEKEWIKLLKNSREVEKIFDYIKDHNDSEASKNTAVDMIKVLMGNKTSNVFTDKEQLRRFMGVANAGLKDKQITHKDDELGYITTNIDLAGALEGMDLSNLSINDWRFMVDNVVKIKDKTDDPNVDDNKLQEIKESAAAVVLLANVKETIEEHQESSWALTPEEWAVLGDIIAPMLVDIGLSFIPGSDIIDVIKGLNENDYFAVTIGLAGLTADLVGATLVKVIAKFGKAAYKSFKIVRALGNALGKAADLIRKGYKYGLENGEVVIRRALCAKTVGNCPIIARGDEVAELTENISNGILGLVKEVAGKIEYKNLSGNVLKWSPQHPNSINQSIASALTSTNPGKLVEGKVGNALKEAGKDIKSFGMKINNSTTNKLAGDIDVETANHLIEVKKTYKSLKEEQLNKFVNSNNDNYLNPFQKETILYIDEPLSAADRANVLSQIPNDVTLINSLDELLNIID